jgi:hypothetical protein
MTAEILFALVAAAGAAYGVISAAIDYRAIRAKVLAR